MDINVTVHKSVRHGGTIDLFASDNVFSERIGTGILTADHAASSYGLAVLVLDGVAYGPGDVENRGWQIVDDDTVFPAPEPEMVAEFRRAMSAARLAVKQP